MNELTLTLSWEYFLGIMSALLGIAWYSSARFTRIETSMKWMKETLNELKIASDNERADAFSSQSPVNLNEKGRLWLEESGLKAHIENNKELFLTLCVDKQEGNPYELQKYIFNMFDKMEMEETLDKRLKRYAFKKGTTMSIMRRIGAIYFRNICLEAYGMDKEDIDRHAPEVS